MAGRFLVLLDRDGTINDDPGLICDALSIRLLPNAAEGIKLLNKKGIIVAIVTNQPVVARNLCTEEDVQRINDHLLSLLGREGAAVDAVFYCPHHPETGHPEANDPRYRIGCDCRKPNPGMLRQASEMFGIPPSNCFMIGDSTRDVLAGKNFGCRTVLVRTGGGGKDGKFKAKPDYVCEDLLSAAELVVSLI